MSFKPSKRVLATKDFEPCNILKAQGTPYVVWCEHALRYHDVPTGLFRLYLLVDDLDQSAKVFSQAGWTLDASAPARIGNGAVSSPQRRIQPPSDGSEETLESLRAGQLPEVVLLRAEDWHFDISANAIRVPPTDISVPSLPGLLDSTIEFWLDLTTGGNMLWIHIGMFISYLYGHNKTLAHARFYECLRYENRQFHVDLLSGNFITGTLPWWRHAKAIRDASRAGVWQLNMKSSYGADLDLLEKLTIDNALT